MNKKQITSYSTVRDSISLASDSILKNNPGIKHNEQDTSTESIVLRQKDSLSVDVHIDNGSDTLLKKGLKRDSRIKELSVGKNRDIIPGPKNNISGNALERIVFFSRHSIIDTTEKQFSYAPVDTFIEIRGEKTGRSKLFVMKDLNIERHQLNWTLIIGTVSIILLLSLKRYYSKFISQVVTTMVNYQLAEKMLREKNIIARRAFFILNLNFVLILTLFLLTAVIYWDYRITQKYIYDYFIILGILVAILFSRLVLLYMTGFLFGIMQVINEHIHISFLVNKNLGLLMLPIVFIILYTSSRISEIAIYLCLGIIIIATFYKIFRGFQIIIRNGVLIFYAFLYLCTLELLPLVIGSKIIISLR